MNGPASSEIDQPLMYYIRYLTFTVSAALFMLNLLIAVMDATLWRVAYKQDELWRMQLRKQFSYIIPSLNCDEFDGKDRLLSSFGRDRTWVSETFGQFSS